MTGMDPLSVHVTCHGSAGVSTHSSDRLASSTCLPQFFSSLAQIIVCTMNHICQPT